MISNALIFALVLAVAACAGCAWWAMGIHNENVHLKADNKTLAANYESAKAAVRVEHEIQTVTKTVYVKAEKAATHVQTIDPKCSNQDELVSAFRTDYDGVQPDTASSASSATVRP